MKYILFMKDNKQYMADMLITKYDDGLQICDDFYDDMDEERHFMRHVDTDYILDNFLPFYQTKINGVLHTCIINYISVDDGVLNLYAPNVKEETWDGWKKWESGAAANATPL